MRKRRSERNQETGGRRRKAEGEKTCDFFFGFVRERKRRRKMATEIRVVNVMMEMGIIEMAKTEVLTYTTKNGLL